MWRFVFDVRESPRRQNHASTNPNSFTSIWPTSRAEHSLAPHCSRHLARSAPTERSSSRELTASITRLRSSSHSSRARRPASWWRRRHRQRSSTRTRSHGGDALRRQRLTSSAKRRPSRCTNPALIAVCWHSARRKQLRRTSNAIQCSSARVSADTLPQSDARARAPPAPSLAAKGRARPSSSRLVSSVRPDARSQPGKCSESSSASARRPSSSGRGGARRLPDPAPRAVVAVVAVAVAAFAAAPPRPSREVDRIDRVADRASERADDRTRDPTLPGPVRLLRSSLLTPS